MHIVKHFHHVNFDDVLEGLVEPGWEAIRTWCFIMFYLEYGVFYYLFHEWSCKNVIFDVRHLSDVK